MTNIKDLPHPGDLIGKWVVTTWTTTKLEPIEICAVEYGKYPQEDFYITLYGGKNKYDEYSRGGFHDFYKEQVTLFPTRAAAQDYINGMK